MTKHSVEMEETIGGKEADDCKYILGIWKAYPAKDLLSYQWKLFYNLNNVLKYTSTKRLTGFSGSAIKVKGE